MQLKVVVAFHVHEKEAQLARSDEQPYGSGCRKPRNSNGLETGNRRSSPGFIETFCVGLAAFMVVSKYRATPNELTFCPSEKTLIPSWSVNCILHHLKHEILAGLCLT